NVNRRRFLKRGLLGGGLLIAAGTLPFAFRTTLVSRRPRRELRLLTLEEFSVLAAVAARLRPRDGAPAAWPSAAPVHSAGKVDALLATVHPDAGNDFRRLLRLFESGFVGTFMAASPRPFTRATPAEQDARLEAWRRSRLTVMRSGYQALKRLTCAAYYAS